MNSLRDQLLKVGLVTEKQAKQAAQEEQQRHFRHRPPKPRDSRPGQGGKQGGNPGGYQGGGQRGGPGQNAQRGQNVPGGQNAHGGQGRGSQGGPNAGAGQNAATNAGPNAGTGPNAGNRPAAQPVVLSAHHPIQSAATLAAQQAQAAKVARDQELNRKREEKAKRRARIAEIEQIIEQNRVPRLETEDYYSFIDGKKIRRMSVDAQRREQLTSGVLAIVRYKGHYAVVPKETAQRIRERDENMVVPFVAPKDTEADTSASDDPYKDFVVPDDLTW
ncbi:MAG: DUF2058 domain-containing protein [Proteobacteria bacterium]|nr:DUF2058 domain-containing protein [Pseudomonadota bacterium]